MAIQFKPVVVESQADFQEFKLQSGLSTSALEAIRAELSQDLKVLAGDIIDRNYRIAGDMLRKVQEEAESLRRDMMGRQVVVAIEIDGIQNKMPADQVMHPSLPEMIVNAKLGLNSLLVGPAGCGKTVAAEQLSRALGLSFGQVCFTAGASESWLFGRQTPNGFIEAEFSRMFHDGGVFLADEIDAADANLLMAINTAIANGHLYNPISGQSFKRHKDFVMVAGANTVGKGGDSVYTARNRLDGSTLDRFEAMQCDYIEEVERKVCPNEALYSKLVSARETLKRLNSDEIISTRRLKNAYLKLSAGTPALDIFKGLTLGWPQELIKQTGLDSWDDADQAKNRKLSDEEARLAKIAENEKRIAELEAAKAGEL
jgi:DNA polymerase III delta prime subunit